MKLALAVINSEEWYGRGPEGLDDRLDVPGWLDSFLVREGVPDVSSPASQDQARLRRLRTLLRRMFTALADGREPSVPDLEQLDGFLRRGVLQRRIDASDGCRVVLAPARRDWDWVLSEIAASFCDVLADGERARIKHCENPECRWAFYDESRNRCRRWCSAAECGNVFKVREFRARQRAHQANDRT